MMLGERAGSGYYYRFMYVTEEPDCSLTAHMLSGSSRILTLTC